MRIIDTHTHFPGTSFSRCPKSGGQLREEFKAEGLSGAWIMTTDGLLGEPVRHNDLLAEGIRDQRDFFVPFCTVSPHQGTEAALRELERSALDLEMKGLKLHPWLQAFSLTHPGVLPILQKAGELGLPVLFHDGTPPYATPLQIAYAAEKVPDTTIILGHAGLDDLYYDAILACQRHENIFLCLCSLSSGYIGKIIRQVPVEKLIFGSDGGFLPGLGKDAVRKVYAACDDETILQAIFYDNPQKMLPYF